MLKRLFLRRKKKTVFIAQLTESAIKVVKFISARGKEPEFSAIELIAFTPPADDAAITQKINEVFRKLKFNFNPIIVSLPRINVTSRYLKVPAQEPAEIERIASLQAPRYLPYSYEELNTGFQIIRTDKEGYSGVNLIIAHRDVVERYVALFKELKPSSISVFLSSFGLCNLYHYCFTQEALPVILLDCDSNQAEVAISRGEKFLFSRSFKVAKQNSGWENSLIEEVKKTRELYLKEVSKEPPQKLIIFRTGEALGALAEALKAQLDLPVEELAYAEKFGTLKELPQAVISSGDSFAGLIGFSVAEVSQYLNLLPLHMKEAVKGISQRRSRIRLVLTVCGLILLFTLALLRNFQNKTEYLKRLKSEMAKISKESKPLEAIERRFRALENRSKEKLTALEALYELHKTIPERISLTSFIYDHGNELIIRGQAQELDYVFEFVARLQESRLLRGLDVKVKYATKKRTPSGEFVDFEIDCIKVK